VISKKSTGKLTTVFSANYQAANKKSSSVLSALGVNSFVGANFEENLGILVEEYAE